MKRSVFTVAASVVMLSSNTIFTTFAQEQIIEPTEWNVSAESLVLEDSVSNGAAEEAINN